MKPPRRAAATKNAPKPARKIAPPALRQWTKANLTENDYAFARAVGQPEWTPVGKKPRSSTGKDEKEEKPRWKTAAGNVVAAAWPEWLARQALAHELRREIGGCDLPPFMEVRTDFEAYGKAQAGLFKPSSSLEEITDLEAALDAVRTQPGFPDTITVALRFNSTEDTPSLVGGFQAWLAGKLQPQPFREPRPSLPPPTCDAEVHADWLAKYQQWQARKAKSERILNRRVFQLSNGASLSCDLGSPGRTASPVRLLCALALRRLSQAYDEDRATIGDLLGLVALKAQKDLRIAHKLWQRLPDEAAEAVREQVRKERHWRRFLRSVRASSRKVR